MHAVTTVVRSVGVEHAVAAHDTRVPRPSAAVGGARRGRVATTSERATGAVTLKAALVVSVTVGDVKRSW